MTPRPSPAVPRPSGSATGCARPPTARCRSSTGAARAVYVEVAGWCVGRARRRAPPQVPCALRSGTPDVRASLAGWSRAAYVVRWDAPPRRRPLPIGRIVDVVPRVGAERSLTDGDPVTVEATPRPRWPGSLPPPLRAAGSTRPRPSALLGRGDGLTPLGDDVLCGWLALHRAAGVATPEVDEAVGAARPTGPPCSPRRCSTAPCTARCCPSSPRGCGARHAPTSPPRAARPRPPSARPPAPALHRWAARLALDPAAAEPSPHDAPTTSSSAPARTPTR